MNWEGTSLNSEERNLLSVAYKNVVGARRASLRIIGSIASKEEAKGESEKKALIDSYKVKVEEELNNICQDILNLLDNSQRHLANAAEELQAKPPAAESHGSGNPNTRASRTALDEYVLRSES